MRFLLVTLLFGLAVGSTTLKSSAQESVSLTVIVTGAQPNTGQAIASLFDSKETYLKAPAQEAVVEIDSVGGARFTFEGLKRGTYAVSVIYDKDSDGELDTGFLGIPTELIAMSNDAKGRLGPPRFRKARFELHESAAIRIRFAKAKE